MIPIRHMEKLIFLLGVFVFIGISSPASTQERVTSTYSSAVSEAARGQLHLLNTLAIFLNGTDPLLTRVVEDALSVRLMKAGFKITSREKLERVLGEQITKKKEEEEGRGTVNAMEIGRMVQADAILTGTVIVVEAEEQFLVRIASLQLVDVETEDMLISVLFESGAGEKGSSFSEIAEEFANILRESAQ
jgi:hypothetical protein